jgi:hypothetical protein
MQKKKLPRDSNSLAARIVAISTGQPEPDITGNRKNREPTVSTQPEKEKNPAAVALGHLGGLKGGKARAEKLSASQRKKIAKEAAKARWG